ncbi:MAG: hypothetical protein Q7I91_10200 [Moraxellaceae bacterium]|nr:hypothetical protein [Moraxellaceae bacterium]
MRLNHTVPTFYRAHFGLLTLHGKESIIAPALTQRWQARLTSSTAFNTDSLGTFSGEVERSLSPVECALHKARLALTLTGAEYGLGSEGSFNTSVWGFGVVNQELVACVNNKTDWFVVGSHTTFVSVAECRYGNAEARQLFWRNLQAGQGVMLISEAHTAKGVESEAEAIAILNDWYGEHIPADLRIRYDLRAHQSPMRQANIALALENLMMRLESTCRQCGRPGFWPDIRETGLPCRDCGFPTNNPRAHIACCEGCGYQESRAVAATHADPATCPMCNP